MDLNQSHHQTNHEDHVHTGETQTEGPRWLIRGCILAVIGAVAACTIWRFLGHAPDFLIGLVAGKAEAGRLWELGQLVRQIIVAIVAASR